MPPSVVEQCLRRHRSKCLGHFRQSTKQRARNKGQSRARGLAVVEQAAAGGGATTSSVHGSEATVARVSGIGGGGESLEGEDGSAGGGASPEQEEVGKLGSQLSAAMAAKDEWVGSLYPRASAPLLSVTAVSLPATAKVGSNNRNQRVLVDAAPTWAGEVRRLGGNGPVTRSRRNADRLLLGHHRGLGDSSFFDLLTSSASHI
ncbi:hypothetical protein NL676_001895 [Syzygium grande]|nr:hypothetical protein NL676_001895 [Syzygium grande]